MNHKIDFISVGTALVDSIIKGWDPTPVSASGYRAQSGTLCVGGEAVNEAIAAAKLGLSTAILCALGEDDAGDMIVNALARNGVDTSLAVRSSDHPTPVTTMFVKDDGTRKSITNESHRYNFHPERYDDRLLGARALILGSLFRAPFNDPDVVEQVVRSAASRGQLLFADTKLPNFTVLTLSDLKNSLPFIDYITPNEDEARYYTGKETPEEMADVFLSYGVKNVIIKLGGNGCFFKNNELTLSLPAYPVKAIDATGAGDNFLAGFVCETLAGRTVREALTFANTCGAICATKVGANTALKNREQVLDFIETNK